MLDAGVPLAFGSDGEYGPLFGIYCAVTRITEDGKHPDGWMPHQKISVEEALRAYTVGTAYASHFEDQAGSLTVGRLADLVVLATDILNVVPSKIRDAQVLLTLMDGKIVYLSPRAPHSWNTK
jgi:predicted amidohydrolase YtcJ